MDNVLELLKRRDELFDASKEKKTEGIENKKI